MVLFICHTRIYQLLVAGSGHLVYNKTARYGGRCYPSGRVRTIFPIKKNKEIESINSVPGITASLNG